MQRYWDLSEKERADLTEAQVEAMLVVECMEKGVARVERPTIEDVPEVTVSKRTYYRVGYDGRYSGKEYFDSLFVSPEQAQSFIDLAPCVSDSDYTIGSEYKYFKHVDGLCVERIDLCTHDSVLNVKPQLEKREATKKRNEQVLSTYNAAAKKVNEATSGVWQDWRECQANKLDNTRVLSTFNEYVGICDGDTVKARTFLGKAFDEQQISDAEKWFGQSFGAIPSVE